QTVSTLREQAESLGLGDLSLIVKDMIGRVVSWNDASEKMYGWRKTEAVGKILHEILMTRFPKPINEIESELLKSQFWKGELTQVKRDGTQIIVESRWVLELDSTGHPLYTMLINFDLTSLKKAELESRESEKRLFQFLNDIPIGIFILDSAGTPY